MYRRSYLLWSPVNIFFRCGIGGSVYACLSSRSPSESDAVCVRTPGANAVSRATLLWLAGGRQSAAWRAARETSTLVFGSKRSHGSKNIWLLSADRWFACVEPPYFAAAAKRRLEVLRITHASLSGCVFVVVLQNPFFTDPALFVDRPLALALRARSSRNAGPGNGDARRACGTASQGRCEPVRSILSNQLPANGTAVVISVAARNRESSGAVRCGVIRVTYDGVSFESAIKKKGPAGEGARDR